MLHNRSSRLYKAVFSVFILGIVLLIAGCLKCRVETDWDRHSAIEVTQDLRWHPSDADALKCMIPGSRIAFQVKAIDRDLLVQHCIDECQNQRGDHHYLLPDSTRVSWTITNGGGALQQNEGETVFYKLPTGATTATLQYEIDTPGDKATDDEHIIGTAAITTRVNVDTSCLEVEIVPGNPNRPTHISEFQDSTAPICRAETPVPAVNAAIQGTFNISNSLCPRATVLLSADFTDIDSITLACDHDECERGEKTMDVSDVLTTTWSDSGAGGTFPFGNTGTQVIYTVPDNPGPINFEVTVEDSGNQFQFDDMAGGARQQSTSSILFDLKEINSSDSGQFRKNITTGRNITFTPEFQPAQADVRRIDWETDLGGADGEIKRKQCSTRRMTPTTVGLKFNRRRQNTELDVAWDEYSHQHGEKELTLVHAWAQECGDACFCDDDAWEDSDFLTGADKNKYKLFFDRDEEKDDGRVENLTTVNADDSWGERTTLRGVEVPNWFLHWSTQTYNASEFNHAQATPPLIYRSGVRWLGLYDHNAEIVYISEEVAKQSDRGQFTGAGWIITSDDKYFDASRTQQRGYDLVGHKLASKVYLHEMAHYRAITEYWAATGAWRRDYGPLSRSETVLNQWNLFGGLPRVTTVLAASGNFGQRAHGHDVHQKFTVTINFNIRNPAGAGTVARTSGPLADAWITSHPNLLAAATAIPQGVPFEVRTATEVWRFRNNQITQIRLPNDPDDDFVPNAIEDQHGTRWDDRRTHRNHERYDPPQGIAPGNYMADQEYWADHNVIGTGTLGLGLDDAAWQRRVDPGREDNDWANPGAQSDPPAD